MASTVGNRLCVLALTLVAGGAVTAPVALAQSAPAAPAKGAAAAARPAAVPPDPPVVIWEPVDPQAPATPVRGPGPDPDQILPEASRRAPGPAGAGARRIPILLPPPGLRNQGMPVAPGAQPGLPGPPAAGMMPTRPGQPQAGMAGGLPPGMLPPGVMPPGAMPPGAVPPGAMPPPRLRQQRPPLGTVPLPPGGPPLAPPPPTAPPSSTGSLGPAAWLVPLLLLGGGAGTFVALRLRQRRRQD